MDAEVDVLIAGAGAAGMTAALVCALQGLDVLLCEQSAQVGGTTATSAGTIWVPGTRQARETRFLDDIAEARRYHLSRTPLTSRARATTAERSIWRPGPK